MKQLSSADSQMLFIETPESPNILGPLNIYDPSTAPGGKVTYKGILKNLESRLDKAPGFRRRLVRVPLDIDEPYWVDDPHFDLEYHVRHLALPKPGDWRQLCILVSRLIARPMDPNRPLWEVNIIEGLDNIEGLPSGCFAILFKIHHAMIDGKAGVELLNVLHDLEPKPLARKSKEVSPWTPEREPPSWKLASKGFRNMILKPGHFFNIAGRNAPRLIKNLAKKKTKVPLRVPKTPFNGHITSARVIDSCFYNLEDFKLIRTLVPGSTVNDVALAVISGALRKYLTAKKQLPDDALIASVPISVRGEAKSEGNELIIQNVPIYTQIKDPKKRLEAICDEMQDTKSYVEAVGAKHIADLTTALPGRVGGFISHAMSRVSEMSGTALISNTLITNVPGVQIPLYMTGAQLIKQCGAGPLAGNIGLSHFVGSYCGELNINVTACRDFLPDPGFYSECIDASYNELYNRAKASTQRKATAKRTTTTTRKRVTRKAGG